ncbi:MAG: hypothetical protein M1834_004805 [Cirrosporium novae-zelandiae]|nr:MAG: hypothetical protein M1834_004805 [Cirrosporium novae-zelandiae]
MEEGVSSRPMKLKILYTFDQDSKVNCLARCSQVLDVRTAFLDERTQIGVVDLKTCIQTVLNASPELVADLGNDYTVYAYDYSEEDTPLVGQGMLSRILASTDCSSTGQLITGRVSKNALGGLLSKGTQETLEVKLRLTPVPSTFQYDFLDNMRKYREFGKFIPGEYDAGAWSAFLEANPSLGQQNTTMAPSTSNFQPQRTGSGMEMVQQILSEASTPMDFNDADHIMSGLDTAVRPYSPYTGSHPSRTASPAFNLQQTLNSFNNKNPTYYQPSSPAPNHIPTNDINDDGFEEGPSKKRAKLVKADWPVQGTIAHQPESLRVVASTAASIRVHRPTPVRPGGLGNLEEPPRAPTPIPKPSNDMQRRTCTSAVSNLRQESSETTPPTPYHTPYLPIPETRLPESAMTSPENSRSGSNHATPTNIPSSPPVMRTSPCPSSPALPTLPPDSGFMSGTLDDLFNDDDEERPIDDDDLEVASHYRRRANLPTCSKSQRMDEIFPGVENPSGDMQPKQAQQASAVSDNQSGRPACNVTKLMSDAPSHPVDTRPIQKVRPFARTQSTSCLPSVVASDPIGPRSTALRRAQSTIGEMAPHPMSDIGTPTFNSLERSRQPRSGSGSKRRQRIEENLKQAISAGEMPQFCSNCGTLDPPTWRKAFERLHSGSMEQVKVSNNDPCGIKACQVLERDEKGDVKIFKIIKKQLYPGETGFTQIHLCNPCGLWLQKTNTMRPQEKWNRRKKEPDDKKKRKRGGSGKNNDANGSAMNNRSRRPSTISRGDGSSPSEMEVQTSPEKGDQQDENQQWEPRSRSQPTQKRPTNSPSTENDRVGKSNANTHQSTNNRDLNATSIQIVAQSSPIRAPSSSGVGSSEHDPIEIDDHDLTPRPTRRLLFPSPRQDGGMKTLEYKSSSLNGGSSSNSTPRTSTMNGSLAIADPPTPLRRSPRLNKNNDLDSIIDKENMPPPQLHSLSAFEVEHPNSDLSYLFEGSPLISSPSRNTHPPRPTTPTPTKSTLNGTILKTPISKSKSPSKSKSKSTHSKKPPRTPKNKLSKSPSKTPRSAAGELTPFTAELGRLLAQANSQSSPMGALFSDVDFDLGAVVGGVDLFGGELIRADDDGEKENGSGKWWGSPDAIAGGKVEEGILKEVDGNGSANANAK